jgi:hypothetical protein
MRGPASRAETSEGKRELPTLLDIGRHRCRHCRHLPHPQETLTRRDLWAPLDLDHHAPFLGEDCAKMERGSVIDRALSERPGKMTAIARLTDERGYPGSMA